MENDQVMEKERENSDKAIKRGIIHQKQFLQEDVSGNYLVRTPRAKLKVIKEY